MMPVPTHLQGLLVPPDGPVDEDALTAAIRCPCGEAKFELLYPGQTHKYGRQMIPCVAEIEGNFFFVLKSRCSSCGREHLLLDADFHGWNGFICHDSVQAALPRPQLVAWQCHGCGESRHTGTICIQTQGKDDFIDEAGEEHDVNRWPDAFGWISLDLACTKCGKVSPELVSYETM